ncbi:hypothetical protein PSN_2477 [Pseudomonas sp. NGC7]
MRGNLGRCAKRRLSSDDNGFTVDDSAPGAGAQNAERPPSTAMAT